MSAELPLSRRTRDASLQLAGPYAQALAPVRRGAAVRFASLAIAACIAIVGSTALAQDARLLAPTPAQAQDRHGVDVMGGGFSDAPVSLTAGPLEGGLTFQPVMTDRGYWRNNLAGAIVHTCAWDYDSETCMWVGGEYLNVSVGGLAGTVFEWTPGSWTPTNGLSAVLTGSGNSWTYTAHDGAVATYALPAVRDYDGLEAGPSLRQAGLASIQTLRRPNGETLAYHYRQTAPGVSVLSSVTSNTGYQIFFEYTGTTQPLMVKAVALNNTVESCVPTASSCSLAGSWPTLTFSQTADSRSVTDSLGRTTLYTYAPPDSSNHVPRVTAVRRPGRTSGQNAAFSYRRRVTRDPPSVERYGPVTGATTDDGVWSYKFGVDQWPNQTEVTDPLGGVSLYETNWYEGTGAILLTSRLRSIRDPLGRVTTNTYEYRPGLGPVLTSVVQPEGNLVRFVYDARGNVTERRAVSKTPGTPADIVETAVYPTVCDNPLTCNRPSSVTDARGGVTDYTYDAAGNLLTETGPAPTPGAPRPQIRYVWEERFAWYKQNGSSVISQAPTPVWVQVSRSQCMTGATC
jgi:YD repeat-containing protein